MTSLSDRAEPGFTIEPDGRISCDRCGMQWTGIDSASQHAFRQDHPTECDDMETPTEAGCCASCDGTGAADDPSTSGRCWDCYGTGHSHAGPCDPTVAEVEDAARELLYSLYADTEQDDSDDWDALTPARQQGYRIAAKHALLAARDARRAER